MANEQEVKINVICCQGNARENAARHPRTPTGMGESLDGQQRLRTERNTLAGNRNKANTRGNGLRGFYNVISFHSDPEIWDCLPRRNKHNSKVT